MPGDHTASLAYFTPEMNRIYLDNAATSFPKPLEVWEAVVEQGREVGANAGRSAYRSAQATDSVIDETRVLLARLLGGRPDRVILTLNTTDALNLALKGFVEPGAHVVTSIMEHNSVRRPLDGLARRRGVRVTTVGADRCGRVSVEDISAVLEPDTCLVALMHASNVCGAVQPIEQVGQLCRDRGVKLLVDAAQTAGSLPIHMADMGIDLLAVPGHKGLLGPLGTGALLLADDVDLNVWREGGTGSSSEELEQPAVYPDHLEAGSPNVPGIAGWRAGLRYIERVGLDAIRGHVERLARQLLNALEEIPGVEIGGPELPEREAIFPIRVEGYRADELAVVLDAGYAIEVRSGLHCAPGAHRALGTLPDGSVRISPGPFTTEVEIERLVAALSELASSPPL